MAKIVLMAETVKTKQKHYGWDCQIKYLRLDYVKTKKLAKMMSNK